MMKIITRDELLYRYKKKYKKIIKDPEERLRDYFKENGLNFEKAKEKAYDKLIHLLENVEYSVIKITLYEYPMKTDRSRLSRRGVYSPNAKSNKKYLNKALLDIYETLEFYINTPAEIDIDAYLEMPSTVKPEEIILYEANILKVQTTPDYDNIGKCYTDMLTDNIIIDDDIFYRGQITKYYSLLPRVDIYIKYQTMHSSDYVFKRIKNRKIVKQLIKDGLLKIKKY